MIAHGDHRDFVVAVDTFLGDRWSSARRRRVGAGDGWDLELFSELGAQGVFSAMLPESLGGLSLPPSYAARLAYVFGRHLVGGPLPESLLIAPWLAGAAPTAVPLLGAVLDGTSVLAFADPEAWASSTPGGVGAFHVDDARLTGEMRLVRFGSQAATLAVVASSDACVALISVPDGRVVIEDDGTIDPASRYARVDVEDIHLDSAVGFTCDGMLVQLRSWLRIAAACEMAGVVNRLVEMTVRHARERNQFGRPIGTFQAVQHMLSKMVESSVSLENLCTAVLADADAGVDGFEERAFAAKAYAASVGPRTALLALQIHGGVGFTDEHDLHLFLKHSLSLERYYGGIQDMHRLLGRRRITMNVPDRRPSLAGEGTSG